MTRKFGILGVALVAVFAMSMAVASMASAATLKVEGGGTATLTGTDEASVVGVLKTTAGSAECTHATYSATGTDGDTAITVTPTYTGCTCLGVACTIDMNGCDYVLHVGATANNGTADLVCSGSEVTLTSTKCIIHVPAQTNKANIKYTEIGAGATREITLDVELGGLSYSHTVGSGVGKCTTGTGNAGTLEAKATVTGSSGVNHVGIWVA